MGQGEIRKRGRVWWLRYYVNGSRYEESAKTTRKEQADALLRERLQSIWEGRFFPGARRRKDLTVEGLRDLWVDDHKSKRSLRHDKARLTHAMEFFGAHRLISTLAPGDIVKWRKSLAGGGAAVATINRHLAALRAALVYAKAQGYGHADPMGGIALEEERNARNRICTPEEYAKLRDAADPDLRLFICMGYWLGMREGELAGVKRAQIRDGVLWLGSSETKEADTKAVPVPSEAKSMIEALPARISGKLFALRDNTYSRKFTALCASLGIKDLRFHDLRHTAITNMIEAGVDVLTIQSITGHKTLHMTKRYAHITNRRRRAALEQVARHATADGNERS